MRRHLLILLLSCAIPLVLIFALPYLDAALSSSGWLLLVLLLCPFMHLFMHRHGNHHQDEPKRSEMK